jgi:hypothetical protein
MTVPAGSTPPTGVMLETESVPPTVSVPGLTETE